VTDATRRESRRARPDRMLAIALDAAEWSLVERWARDGTLPHLARLLEQGTHGRLASTAGWLAGTPWPSFYTGRYPPDHGFLFHLQWRPDRMRHERPSHDWLPLTPFYRRFGQFGRRVIAIDVPITYPAGGAFDGIEVTSWSTHDKIAPTVSRPPHVMAWINREFGTEPITIESGGLQAVRPLLRLRDELVRSADREAALCEALMQRERWDFFLIALGGAHRGGHKLWDRTSVEGRMSPDEAAEYDRALRDVYVACDATVGRIVRAAGPDVITLVFALHGMWQSTSRYDLLPEMLERVLTDRRESLAAMEPKHRLLRRLRSVVPLEWRTSVKQRLPERLQDVLSRFWRGVDARDWSRTRAFWLMGDLQALVQINLRGRERQGIVEPGHEYDTLRERVADGLLTFRDADSGERLVQAIGRGDTLYPEARSTVGLPDLVVRWNDTPCVTHRAIVSPRYGTIDWPSPGHPLDGRSGHHGPDGWLIAAGGPFPAGAELRDLSIFDLNATIHALLDVPRPPEMIGEPPRELRREALR